MSLERAMIAIRSNRGVVYSARLTPSGNVIVTAGEHVQLSPSELGAHLWLGDHGLRRARIKKLLDAACRNEGDYANPDHPKRVK